MSARPYEVLFREKGEKWQRSSNNARYLHFASAHLAALQCLEMEDVVQAMIISNENNRRDIVREYTA